jgi:hypothetical protein
MFTMSGTGLAIKISSGIFFMVDQKMTGDYGGYFMASHFQFVQVHCECHARAHHYKYTCGAVENDP